jgi:hypothetical protein
MRKDNCEQDRQKPDVSIRIINWNTHELLEQCIESILKNTQNISYELVIIDNNSTSPGFDRIEAKFSECENITWIKNDKNLGGFVDHLTLPHCHGRYLLILGPDTIVLPDAIKTMVDFMDDNKQAGAVTAKLLNPDGSPQNYYNRFWSLSMVFFSTPIGRLLDKILFRNRFKRYYFGGDIDPNKIQVIDQPAAACLMLRWEPRVVDYITSEDFPFYFNDVDLCKRIYNNGYKIYLLSTAEVIHFQSSSFKQANKEWRLRERRSSIIKYFIKYHKKKVIFLKLILFVDDISRYVYNNCEKLFPNLFKSLKKLIS